MELFVLSGGREPKYDLHCYTPSGHCCMEYRQENRHKCQSRSVLPSLYDEYVNVKGQ